MTQVTSSQVIPSQAHIPSARVQRMVAAALVVLQASALGYFFRTPVFSTVAIVLVIVATFTQNRFLSERVVQRLPILLVIVFVIQRTVLPLSWAAGKSSFLIPDAVLIAEYLLVYQIALFFAINKDDRLPSFLPILAIAAVVFIGDVRVDPSGRVIYQLLSLALVMLAIGYYFASRRIGGGGGGRFSVRHVVWLISVAIFCATVGWVSASGLYRYARQIEDTMNAFINPSLRPDSAGFSGSGRIGSVARQKDLSGDRVALRVYADSMPGYLRGKAFGYYRQGQWQREARAIPLTPLSKTDEASVLGGGVGGATFDLTQAVADQTGESQLPLDIWPSQPYREVLFTPLGVSKVRAPVDRLSIDIHRIVTADMMPPETPYRTWRLRADGVDSIDKPKLRPKDWLTLTALPDDLDPRIGELAREVIGEAVTTGDKIAAVENFFLDHYQYQFGIEIPDATDPIAYFLLERPPAHCEYFASGAAVLLRSVGVPCRYVTGLIAVEKNDYGDYWLARNRDAHAWAEAYDPERGWVLVEATPASGVPQSTQVSGASQLWDAVQAWWAQLVASIRMGGIGRLVWMVLSLLLNPIVPGVLALLAAGWLMMRFAQRRRLAVAEMSGDPRVQQIQEMLAQMDRRWRKAGVDRQPHETMHQFASRLEGQLSVPDSSRAAEWYRKYATIRYSGGVNDESVNLLRQLGS
ncbi:transglutaminase family protein [Aporhodopirellula aestuarii]|uniref:DUF3488 and transglutaminase-like domain-containing protein n=1 Tax=Aporhodopirellula aestuarii TaxID=2950107 RepID=A0ABT0TXT7_9BACT|nr:transglutaminase domain-containing protein [Aporhodopirellula aestuarii]MCM2369403.1 DUF3488 and transglutaminase-like domain-containing protein [Aporhodopirellula aestuarii]